MRRYSPHTHLRGRARWSVLALALTFLLSLFLTAGGAQAVVVSDQGTSYGVVMPAGTSLPSGVTPDSSTAPCVDPAMQFTPDLTYLQATTPLCWRGGSVIHANETFALTWDPYRSYWSGTRGYVEQFLRDVADGSGTFSSPYALTSQYTDSTTLAPNSSFLVSSRAVNNSKYGGGCIDYGSVGGSDCQIGAGTTQGHDYPGTNGMGSCYVSGSTACLTDSDIQGEVNAIVGDTQLTTDHQAGYTPAVVVLTPPNAVVCLDSARTLCSANGSSTGFCSYHSQVNGIVYVVQPWTIYTGCDEPNLPALPQNPTPQQLATDAGSRLVGPLSQGQIDAIVNPGVSDGWIANSGAEMSDNNGCVPEGPTADTVSVGSGSYVLPREFDNGAAIASDPNTYGGCAPDVILSPTFVIPSAVNQGDVVEFDGSPTASTLIVPNAGYQWSFGDGTTATGPSVVHSYAAGGSYPVTLTVTDRGGNVAELSQTIVVLNADGQVVTSSNSQTTGQTSTNTATTSSGFHVRLQLMPQGLNAMLRHGVAVVVSSNEPADGLVYVSISRAEARRAHIKAGRGPLVTLGRGTVSGIKDGTASLHLHLRLSPTTITKLERLRHVTLTIRLALVASGNARAAIDAAASY